MQEFVCNAGGKGVDVCSAEGHVQTHEGQQCDRQQHQPAFEQRIFMEVPEVLGAFELRLGLPESLRPQTRDHEEGHEAGDDHHRHQSPGLLLHAAQNDREFGPEAGEWRDAHQRKERDGEQQADFRVVGVESAHLLQLVGASDLVGDPAEHEQIGLHEDVVDHVKDRAGEGQLGVHGQAGHHEADVADDEPGEDLDDVVAGEGTEGTRQQGEESHHEQHVFDEGVAREHQRKDPQQGIYAHLGEESPEDGRHGWRRRVVGGRQPEVERENRRFDAEADEENQRAHIYQGATFDLSDFDRQIGHVQRAGESVQDRQGREEDDGGQQIQREVLHRPFELCLLPPERQQHERTDNHHFEPDVEVEDVAREEGAVEPHDEQVQDGKKAEAQPLVDHGAGGKERNGQGDDRSEQHHGRGQGIGHHGDAEGGDPAACLEADDALLPHAPEQPNGGAHRQHAPHDTDHALVADVVPGEHQHDGQSELQQNGRYEQVMDHAYSSKVFISSKSSVFTTLYTRLMSTMAKACRPKLITMAVRISAWGTGSA